MVHAHCPPNLLEEIYNRKMAWPVLALITVKSQDQEFTPESLVTLTGLII
jgi:hypothetical protein